MKRLNQVIGGGAIAIAVMLMAGVMGHEMQARPAKMPTKTMRVCNPPMTTVKITANKAMSPEMKME